MSEINKNKSSYANLVEKFGRDKIEDHCATIYAAMEVFLERYRYTDKVIIADSIIFQAVIDYFSDIYRLKDFHNIEKVNENKIHAYTAYWIIKRKPLQIIKDDDEDLMLPFINEKFVQTYILSYLKSDNEDMILKDEDRVNYDSFCKNLEYFLKYRVLSPQMLETMMEAFLAGQSYQHSLDWKKLH